MPPMYWSAGIQWLLAASTMAVFAARVAGSTQ
jgi:hypothetical protein